MGMNIKCLPSFITHTVEHTERGKQKKERRLQDLNLRTHCVMVFETIPLTTRASRHAEKNFSIYVLQMYAQIKKPSSNTVDSVRH